MKFPSANFFKDPGDLFINNYFDLNVSITAKAGSTLYLPKAAAYTLKNIYCYKTDFINRFFMLRAAGVKSTTQ